MRERAAMPVGKLYTVVGMGQSAGQSAQKSVTLILLSVTRTGLGLGIKTLTSLDRESTSMTDSTDYDALKQKQERRTRIHAEQTKARAAKKRALKEAALAGHPGVTKEQQYAEAMAAKKDKESTS